MPSFAQHFSLDNFIFYIQLEEFKTMIQTKLCIEVKPITSRKPQANSGKGPSNNR